MTQNLSNEFELQQNSGVLDQLVKLPQADVFYRDFSAKRDYTVNLFSRDTLLFGR